MAQTNERKDQSALLPNHQSKIGSAAMAKKKNWSISHGHFTALQLENVKEIVLNTLY